MATVKPFLEELRKTYEGFEDEKLVRFATEEANGLRPEAINLLKQIIKERGLSDDISNGIDAQIREVSVAELTEYCELLRKLPCPICNSSGGKLNATITGTVVSFIIITNYEKQIVIACPECLDKRHNSAMLKSALLGWWGLPWGIIKTIQSLLFNNKMKNQNGQFEASDILKAFVLERVGRIEANKTNSAELRSLIKHIK